MREPVPCPFCGGRAQPDKVLREGFENFKEDPDAYAHFVRCISCAAQGPWCKSSPEGAILQWNRRAPANHIPAAQPLSEKEWRSAAAKKGWANRRAAYAQSRAMRKVTMP